MCLFTVFIFFLVHMVCENTLKKIMEHKTISLSLSPQLARPISSNPNPNTTAIVIDGDYNTLKPRHLI